MKQYYKRTGYGLGNKATLRAGHSIHVTKALLLSVLASTNGTTAAAASEAISTIDPSFKDPNSINGQFRRMLRDGTLEKGEKCKTSRGKIHRLTHQGHRDFRTLADQVEQLHLHLKTARDDADSVEGCASRLNISVVDGHTDTSANPENRRRKW